LGRHLYIIVPFFPAPKLGSTATGASRDPTSVQKAETRFREKLVLFDRWAAKRIPLLKYTYKLDAVEPLALMPERTFVLEGGAIIKYEPDPSSGPIGAQEEEIIGVPKGVAVRLALIYILNDVDRRRGADGREQTVVVQIDGSGAFQYDSIFSIVQKLEMENHLVVLGNRPDYVSGDRVYEWLMWPRERKIIERFENALLSRAYYETSGVYHTLEDGQAGCWGLRVSVLGDLSLSASDYELEYDLLASIVTSGRKPIFSDKLIGGDRIGDTPPDRIDHRKTVGKMPFILYKARWSKDRLSTFLEEYRNRFKGDRDLALPDDYVNELIKWIRGKGSS
jgi:hypothetical protein